MQNRRRHAVRDARGNHVLRAALRVAVHDGLGRVAPLAVHDAGVQADGFGDDGVEEGEAVELGECGDRGGVGDCGGKLGFGGCEDGGVGV